MTKHDFINQIRSLNLSKEEETQLWDLYYDLEDYYANNQEFNEEKPRYRSIIINFIHKTNKKLMV